ncbi:MAG: arylsulfatase [Bacteroidia bacterium]|nr:arylsulfatase [Bacteroidia bacterium]
MILKNLIQTTAVFFPVLSGFSSCMSQTEKHPNIVVILSDDQGWGDLSTSGNTNLSTPNIDRLANTGVKLDRFYVCPVSSPTRAEFLTGRYHSRLGVYSTSEGGERMNLDETTIADVFKKAGYATAAFGKWHNGMQYPYHPNARGFDEFYGFCSGHWGDYFNTHFIEHNGEIVQGNGFITDDLTEKAMAFIDNHKDKPFFLYVPYNTPHSPMQVPDRWWNKFNDKKLEMVADERVKEDIPFTRAALAMCENIDWNVGRIMDKLKELNLEENTIVLYFSDNGPNGWRWNGGMKGKKGSTDEGGVRSPLIIRWSGTIASGSQISEITGAIDLLPTLADMAGIKYQTQKPLDGLSLKPLLLKDKKGWDERLIISDWSRQVSIRSQEYRLDNQGKLFNMITDPGQLTDISASEPIITEKLKKEAEKWKTDVLAKISPDDRRFPVGHPDFKYTQLPARDGKAHGNIVRSGKAPNSSFFTNWTNLSDRITWDVEVLSEGDFEAEIYYTCPSRDVGAMVQLSFNSNMITAKVTEANDPPLRGMENDRVERSESYVKDFKPLKAGIIHLEKGTGELTLKALDIPGSMVMDFRLLMLTRIN